jgi:hypothetical protein
LTRVTRTLGVSNPVYIILLAILLGTFCTIVLEVLIYKIEVIINPILKATLSLLISVAWIAGGLLAPMGFGVYALRGTRFNSTVNRVAVIIAICVVDCLVKVCFERSLHARDKTR